MIEIQTTIRGGLPVIARGYYQRGFAGTYWEPHEPETIEDIELFWMPRRGEKLRPCSIEPTADELDQLELEMLERDTT